MELKLLKQDIDYDKIVTGKDLDYDTYNAKFAMWDHVIKNGLLSSSDIKLRAQATLLLKDPTLYTYAFLKDEEGNNFKYFAFQDAIATTVFEYTTGITDPMHPSRYILFQGSNQLGKTGLEKTIIIKRFFSERNKNIALITNRRELTSFILTDIKILISNSVFGDNWKLDYEEVSNNQTILSVKKKDEETGLFFINRIIVAPAGEGSLGYPLHYIFLDECDFYEDKTLFSRIFEPRLNFTKGQVVAFSNPNPNISQRASLLWEMIHSGLFRRRFKFMYLDNPRNTREEYEFKKARTAEYIFTSTYDGEFSPDSGGFFKKREIEDMLQSDWLNVLPNSSKSVYIGLDLAKVRDSSVLVLGIVNCDGDDRIIENLEIDVRYMLKFPEKTDYNDVIDRLKEIVDYYDNKGVGVAAIGFDATGVGKAVEEIIEQKGISAVSVIFSSQHKSEMYTNFKMLAEQRKIKIVYDEECHSQLEGLIFKKTAGKHLQVQHETEETHDDYPDAICCLIDVSVFPSYEESSVTFIGGRV